MQNTCYDLISSMVIDAKDSLKSQWCERLVEIWLVVLQMMQNTTLNLISCTASDAKESLLVLLWHKRLLEFLRNFSVQIVQTKTQLKSIKI